QDDDDGELLPHGTINGKSWGEYLVAEYASPRRVDVRALVDTSPPACGVLFPAASGILWQQQAGGMMIRHPALEGLYVPLPHAAVAAALAASDLGCCATTRAEREEAHAHWHSTEGEREREHMRRNWPELAEIWQRQHEAFARGELPLGLPREEADA